MSVTDIGQLQLLELPIESPEFAQDPLPWIEHARSMHPWLARCRYGYVVTDYRANKQLLMQDDKLVIALGPIVDFMGAAETGWGRFMLGLMVGKSDAEHARFRGVVEPFFKPRMVVGLVGRIRAVIAELLEEWAPKRAFDFAEFAANFPIVVVMEMIGADREALHRIRASLETLGQSFSIDSEALPALDAAYDAMVEFATDLISARRRSGNKPPDLLQALIDAEATGRLSEAEARDMLIFLFGAAYDTSKNMLTLVVARLLEFPAIWARCAEDRTYCTSVVEEALRISNPANSSRVAREDFVYREVAISRGTSLMFTGSVSGQDPAVFASPSVFDPDRVHAERHIAFGRGAHICLGQHLARLQIEEGLHSVAQRLREPRLTGPIRWRHFPGVWGIRSLPIAFTLGLRTH